MSIRLSDDARWALGVILVVMGYFAGAGTTAGLWDRWYPAGEDNDGGRYILCALWPATLPALVTYREATTYAPEPERTP